MIQFGVEYNEENFNNFCSCNDKIIYEVSIDLYDVSCEKCKYMLSIHKNMLNYILLIFGELKASAYIFTDFFGILTHNPFKYLIVDKVMFQTKSDIDLTEIYNNIHKDMSKVLILSE